jgi:hypothetical protein
MTLSLTIGPHDILTIRLQEGREHAAVSVRPSVAGATSLARALDAAMAHGYGECFWPGDPGGQYWWIFKRDDETLETIAMWTRGGASLWEHVFRATDAAAWVHDRLMDEIRRLGLTTPT